MVQHGKDPFRDAGTTTRRCVCLFLSLHLLLLVSTTTAKSQQVWLGCDVEYDSLVKVAIEALRDEEQAAFYETTIASCCSSGSNTNSSSSTTATTTTRHGDDYRLAATMVGYKGGPLLSQVNQDRAFVLEQHQHEHNGFVISGVLDGHGGLGHFVAEYGRHSLMEKLSAGLDTIVQTASGGNDGDMMKRDDEDWSITALATKLLQETFVEIDAALPDVPAKGGGATISIVVQVGGHIFLANAGDSQSWLSAAVVEHHQTVEKERATSDSDPSAAAAAAAATTTYTRLLEVQVVQQTRLDKPDDPEEMIRLRAAGMHVTPESEEDSARVYYQNAETGQVGALAMSRALGDRDAHAVTAQPLVTVLSVSDVVETILSARQQACQTPSRDDDNDNETTSTTSSDTCTATNAEEKASTLEVRLFAMSATDGLIDYLSMQDMAESLAQALFENDPSRRRSHPLTVAQDLIQQSAAQWRSDMHGEYRDDMALALAVV